MRCGERKSASQELEATAKVAQPNPHGSQGFDPLNASVTPQISFWLRSFAWHRVKLFEAPAFVIHLQNSLRSPHRPHIRPKWLSSGFCARQISPRSFSVRSGRRIYVHCDTCPNLSPDLSHPLERNSSNQISIANSHFGLD